MIVKKICLAGLALLIIMPAIARNGRKKKKGKHQNQITAVVMHRTACYGRCPDYTIEINKDGTITYTGIRFVEDSGVYRKKIGADKAGAILNKLNESRVDTCRRMYTSRIQDLPGLFFTVKYTDSVKSILNANWGPAYLSEIAGEMEVIGRKPDATWEKVTGHK